MTPLEYKILDTSSPNHDQIIEKIQTAYAQYTECDQIIQKIRDGVKWTTEVVCRDGEPVGVLSYKNTLQDKSCQIQQSLGVKIIHIIDDTRCSLDEIVDRIKKVSHDKKALGAHVNINESHKSTIRYLIHKHFLIRRSCSSEDDAVPKAYILSHEFPQPPPVVATSKSSSPEISMPPVVGAKRSRDVPEATSKKRVKTDEKQERAVGHRIQEPRHERPSDRRDRDHGYSATSQGYNPHYRDDYYRRDDRRYHSDRYDDRGHYSATSDNYRPNDGCHGSRHYQDTRPRAYERVDSPYPVRRNEGVRAVDDRSTIPAQPRRHSVTLRKKYIHQIRSGQKTIEGRINSGMMLKMKPGDEVRFFYMHNKFDDVVCKITKIEKFVSFAEMLEACGYKNCITDVRSLREAIDLYASIPKYPEKAARFGVLAIHIQSLGRSFELR